MTGRRRIQDFLGGALQERVLDDNRGVKFKLVMTTVVIESNFAGSHCKGVAICLLWVRGEGRRETLYQEALGSYRGALEGVPFLGSVPKTSSVSCRNICFLVTE